MHQRQRVGLDEGAVLDGVDAGGDGHLRRGVAVAVRGDLAPPVMRLLDDGVHLVLRELGRVDGIGEGEDAARGHEFDDVGAVLDLVAHRGAALVGAVADAVQRPLLRHAARGRNRIAVAVAASGADGVNGHEHARPRHEAGVDGIAQADVDVVARADVAHGREARIEGLLRI